MKKPALDPRASAAWLKESGEILAKLMRELGLGRPIPKPRMLTITGVGRRHNAKRSDRTA